MPRVRLSSRIPREAPVSQQGYHQPLEGGGSDDRPADPYLYQMYFDTDLGQPIWNNDGMWVTADGANADGEGEGE